MSRAAPTVPVLHVDEHLLVVDKPAGLLSVPGRGPDKQDCVAARVQAQWPDALVVHRLDEATSGLLLMARGVAAQRRLSTAFERGEIDKHYEAIVHGQVLGEAGEIDLPLAADWPNRPRQQVDLVNGKASRTSWGVISRDRTQDTTRLALQPRTGRSHQLRVHLLAMGHPIVGDALYGPPSTAMCLNLNLRLHACAVGLQHPGTGEWVRYLSPVPF